MPGFPKLISAVSSSLAPPELELIGPGLPRKRHFIVRPGLVVLLCLIWICAGSVSAQNWTGTTNGSWGDNTNWSAALVSGPNTRITFGANMNTNTIQNHPTNPFVLNSLTFDDTAAFTIAPGNPLQFETGGTPAAGPQVFNNGTKTQKINVPININSATLKLGGSGTGKIELNGAISDQPVGTPRAVLIQGSGEYVLGDSATSVQNFYTGNTTLSSGTLVIDNTQALGPSGTLKLGAGTIRASTTASYTIGNAVSLDGDTIFGGAASSNSLTFSSQAKLTGNRNFTANNVVTNFKGGITDNAAGFGFTLKGDATVVGVGNARTLSGGRLKIGANSPIGGALTIMDGGALIIERATVAGTPVNPLTVQAKGFFGGIGGVIAGPKPKYTGKVTFKNQATFKCPADGALDVEGGVEFESGSIFAEDIAGTLPGDYYTQLNVTNGPGAIDPGAILDIITTVPLNIGDTFEIMTRDAPAPIGMNMFSDINGMSLPEGTTFTEAGYQFRINYGAIAGGPDTGGNDVRLTVIPEPSVGALFVAVVALRAVARRRSAASR